MGIEVTKFSWIFAEKISVDEQLVSDLFVEGEQWVIGYKTVRDSAVFTNKRIIIRDKQGFTGKKIETYSIPYSIILMYSVENAGTFDLTSEVELWTKVGVMKLNFKRDFDIVLINKLLSDAVLD